MQEEEDFGGVGVAFGKGEEVEVVVTDVEVLLVHYGLHKQTSQVREVRMQGIGRRRYVYALV